MRWVALQPKGGNYFRGNLFVQPATQGMSEMLSFWVKTLFKKPFPRLCLHFLFMKTCFFPTWVSADILYLFLSIFNIFPEPIYHQRSYFHMFLILMCWQFNFPKKKSRKRAHLPSKTFWSEAYFPRQCFLRSWHLAHWETFQGRRVTAALLIIVKI